MTRKRGNRSRTSTGGSGRASKRVKLSPSRDSPTPTPPPIPPPIPTPTPTGSSRSRSSPTPTGSSRSRKRVKQSPTPPIPTPTPPIPTPSVRSPGPGPAPGRGRSRSRSRSQVAPPTDFEIIQQLLLYSVSDIDFISDDSLYSFILHGKILAPACVNGIEVSSFCMKITFVKNEKMPNNYSYSYTTIKNQQEIEKKTIHRKALDKEVVVQRKLYDSFISAPFVPRVIAASIFLSDEFIDMFTRLLNTKKRGVVFDINARSVVTFILDHLQHTPCDVHIFLMEYIDEKTYATLDECSLLPGGKFNTTICESGYQHMAANLVCAAGVECILYDAHNRNGLFSRSKKKVMLLDFADSYDLSVNDDIKKMKQMFSDMVSRMVSHMDSKSITRLCSFFNVEDQGELLAAFDANLRFTDFRTQEAATIDILDIHHSLMMVAFIDFMMNNPKARCRYAMESVYGNVGFSNFSNFIERFNLVLPPSVSVYDKNLTKVAGFIMDIVNPRRVKEESEGHKCLMQGGRRKKKSKCKRKCKRNRKTRKYY